MSNGDDVLDNWEEIDEVGLNTYVQKLKNSSASSCERITEFSYKDTNITPTTGTISPTTGAVSSSRPSQMKVLQRSNTQDSTTASSTSKPLTKSPLDDMAASFQPVMMVLHKPQDEYQSANYTAPISNQTVKILRRPTQSSENRNNFIRPKQPIKTLQQREQEYAEARLRILGSAKNPEDDEQRASTASPTAVATTITNSTTSTPTVTSTVAMPPSSNSVMNIAPTTKINSPKMQVGANQYNNHYNQQLQQQQQQQKYLQNFQQQQQQQQQQQNYFYNQQQPPQQPPPPAYNNNRTYNVNPLLALGPMGAIGQPAQYHATTLSSPQTQQQHMKFSQYHQKSPQQHKVQQQLQQQQQTWSPVVGGSVSSSSIIRQQQQQQQNDTILRLPRGPDGSTGFQMRR